MNSRVERAVFHQDGTLWLELVLGQFLRRDSTGDERIDPDRSQAILGALADTDGRAIIAATAQQPRSVSDIVDECEIPIATVYRKVNHLVEIGLLEERIQIQSTGRNKRLFTLRVAGIRAEITEDGDAALSFVVQQSPDGTPSQLSTDGGRDTDAETQHLKELFVSVTGTGECVETQDGTDQSRHLDASADESVSRYITDIAKADGLGETLPDLGEEE
ncbi:helix-turn-helix domain-containing protein [Halovenus marina]|uniref:helix-turn-helix domain-containing protein n=1 Tax=Halovenus marina TaxID=3396621 RepID=UPI003F5801B3